MRSTSLFRWYYSPTRRTDRRVGRPQTSCCRLALETLEIRTLPSVTSIPLPPAPAGFPIVSSATARLDGQGNVFGTATYSNNGFPPQFKSEAFVWQTDGGLQLLTDAANQPYQAVVDLGADGSVLARSNNPNPYTAYFEVLSPDFTQATLVPLPPAPAGFPVVSSASARLDGQGNVFGTATYSNNGFPPQFKSEAFVWQTDGSLQLLTDAANQPYQAVVDLGADGSILARSNNSDPYTAYFEVLSPDFTQATLVPLPPAPAGFPVVSSATARFDAQGNVFGTATYSNNGFPPQFKGEAFVWQTDGSLQLLTDAANQPYQAVVDLGADGSVLARSNNPNPYTAYFEVLSPDFTQATLVPLPPAPAGFPMVSSATARFDAQGDVLGTATYVNSGFPPQFKSEAFLWTADGGTQLLTDATNQPYSAVVDFGTDGSILVRSNNPDPYTSYFDLLSPDRDVRAFLADLAASSIPCADVLLPPDRCASGVVVGSRQTGHGQVGEFTASDPQVTGPYLQHWDKAFPRKGDSVPQLLTNQTNYLLGVFDDPIVEAAVDWPAT